ncbi:MAG: AAA family ATPase [Rhodocyclaceae bacterium]|nr:AAA family ATPase [Rhodocyclaceae bacterium]MBX3667813.1 AAA family ATPase [Rhodocyclaceae bacterium]
MFRILTLEVVHWDFWQRATLPLDAPIVTIVGPNGSGKTTLLDALRTLLAQDCSRKRDYKRYARKSGAATTWLRGVVDNRRSGNRTHPFFPLLADQVTLACRIEKKGGDWAREYCIAEGDQSIEQLARDADWLGVREYMRRLLEAGLSRAIARVLSLEQGQTDKLCEYSARELLDLVFHVFGDKQVLDRYQEAHEHQRQIERELDEVDGQQARLGAEVERLHGQLNRHREYRSLMAERSMLAAEVLPRLQWHELRHAITGARAQLRPRRREWRDKRLELARLQSALPALAERARAAGERLTTLDAHLQSLQEARSRAERREERASTLLEQRTRLVDAMQMTGEDAPGQLAARESALLAERDRMRLERERLTERAGEVRGQISRLARGDRADPPDVQALRDAFQRERIGHDLLPEIVEVLDDSWQTAVEALLHPLRHLVLLHDANDQARAFALGESLRYRHFIVPERQSPASATPGSLLEVVQFNAPVPGWLSALLDRTRRVESPAEGAQLPRGQDWITRSGYLRERRGGRHAGGAERHFGRGRLAALEAEQEELAGRIAALDEKLAAGGHAIATLQSALAAAGAPAELSARAAEFARAEADQAAAAAEIAALKTSQVDAYAARAGTQDERVELATALERDQTRARALAAQIAAAENRPAREENVRRILRLRAARKQAPAASWLDAAANARLAEKWESARSVERELERLQRKLDEGDWVKDDTVEALYQLRLGDHQRQQSELERRRDENRRAAQHTDHARAAYIDVLRHTLRIYARNLKDLGKVARVAVELVPPHLENDDITLAQAGLEVRFDFDEKGFSGMNDGEASGGQQVIKSLILLIALMMDEARPGGFVFIDEPFAHLDIVNIDRVAAFLKATRAQYLITTPITHNVNVYDPAMITLVTFKKRPGEHWAPRIGRLVREPA